MKTKVIFIQNIAKVGKIGEIKEVATSYAMNFLIPKKYATLATDTEIKKLEEEKKNKENKKRLENDLFLKAMETLQNELNKQIGDEIDLLIITGHKHNNGKLFASIHAEDITNAIYQKIKISLNPSQIILPKEQIKAHGIYEIEIIGGENNKKKIKILVK